MDPVDNPEKMSIEHLCELVTAMSVHQRQMAKNIENLQAHHEQLYAQQNQVYSQIDALFSIFSMISIRHPLPTMRGWPVSPDFVKLLMSLIFEIKPTVMVEAGSGVSTLISAYCFEKIGQGTVTSLDHDALYAEETRKNLKLHGLETVASVHYCPLNDMRCGTESYPWYTIPGEMIPKTIDLLVIDGPPANLGPQVRYPSIPFFFEHLSDKAVILLDDAAREGERQIVERWMNDFGCFEHTFVETEKGAVVLRR